MQSIDLSGIEQLTQRFDRVAKQFKPLRMKYHVKVAGMIQEELVNALGSSEKIANWQEMHIGSKGGYAAVRAAVGFYTYKNGERYPYGYITNSIENGHRIRQRSHHGRSGYHLGRTAYVNGKHFYEKARASVEAAAIQEAYKVVEEIERILNG